MTLLAKHFSPEELRRLLNTTLSRSQSLTVDELQTITLEELQLLKPYAWKSKKPKSGRRRGRPRKLGDKTDPGLPGNLDSFRIIIKSRNPPIITMGYKGRRAVMKDLIDVSSTRVILNQIFEYADMSDPDLTPPQRRASRHYKDFCSRTYSGGNLTRRKSEQLYKQMSTLFREELPKLRKLSKNPVSIENLYGVEPLKGIDHASEGIVDDELTRSCPSKMLRTTMELSFSYEPFLGSDLELIEYIKKIDYLYYQVKTQNEIRYYTHSGSFIAGSNLKEHYLVLYNNIHPIDRPFKIAPSIRGGSAFPVFSDTIIAAIRHNGSTIVITKEGTVITRLTPEQFEAAPDRYNVHSKLCTDRSVELRLGEVKINRV